jgi:hypothetical protein
MNLFEEKLIYTQLQTVWKIMEYHTSGQTGLRTVSKGVYKINKQQKNRKYMSNEFI